MELRTDDPLRPTPPILMEDGNFKRAQGMNIWPRKFLKECVLEGPRPASSSSNATSSSASTREKEVREFFTVLFDELTNVNLQKPMIMKPSDIALVNLKR
jgi:hypothetical protein